MSSSRGFEARAVGSDGARYLWHRDSGLRTDGRTGATTLLTDPSGLPEAMWFPTMFGLEELEEARSRECAPKTRAGSFHRLRRSASQGHDKGAGDCMSRHSSETPWRLNGKLRASALEVAAKLARLKVIADLRYRDVKLEAVAVDVTPCHETSSAAFYRFSPCDPCAGPPSTFRIVAGSQRSGGANPSASRGGRARGWTRGSRASRLSSPPMRFCSASSAR